MKRLIPVFSTLLLLITAAPAFAFDHGDVAPATLTAHSSRRPMIIDDVIRMSQAGVGDEAVIAYVQKYRDRFDINADDVIALNDAHVSRDVIKTMVNESSARKSDRSYDAPVQRVYTGVYYDPWFYPYSYYDPFWYGPRVGLSFRFGPRYGGGGFHHRHR